MPYKDKEKKARYMVLYYENHKGETKAYRKGRKEEGKDGYQHEDLLRTKYKMSPEDYSSLLEEQGGHCALCLSAESVCDGRTLKTRKLSVDHSHLCCAGVRTCGKCVRGILCHMCNVRVGGFEAALNNVIEISLIPGTWHHTAMEYLNKYKTKRTQEEAQCTTQVQAISSPAGS